MAGTPSFPHYTSTQEILRSLTNLPGEHVEEVFQGIARMPQISSVVLDCMPRLLSDMFEDSRDVLLSYRGGQAPNRKASKSQCKPPVRGRVTRSNAKAWKEETRTEWCVEEDTNEMTESDEKHTTTPIHESAAKVHKLNIQLQIIGPCH